jgi:putative MATE family efflux protein
MAILVNRSVGGTLLSMAVPMLAGTLALNAYNLTDTWFISRLGKIPLAAMGYTLPVVMLLACVARGIGAGVTTLVSHAIGRGDHSLAAKLVTHSTWLMLVLSAIVTVGGYLLVTPVFSMLGAEGQTLELVGQYMRTWYAGAIFMILPMLGNGVLISAGDSKSASRFMMIGMFLNLVLDPILIFGWAGIPALGMFGAALATVIAQAVSTGWLVWLLCRKHRLIVNLPLSGRDFLASLSHISGFAIPSILSLILMPVSAGVITKLLSRFGDATIAAVGAAGRIEMFAFVVPMALGISLTPFVSQNFGANRPDRVHRAHVFSTWFALGYGALTAVVFFVAAPFMARLFSTDQHVVDTLVSYIRIISFGYGLMEVHRYCGFFLMGTHKPKSATMLNIIRIVVLLIPLSWLGARFWGVTGVFGGRLVTDVLGGLIALAWVSRSLKAAKTAHQAYDSHVVGPDHKTVEQRPQKQVDGEGQKHPDEPEYLAP